MNALDGNAIAGTLLTAFGDEMTAAICVCASCAAESRVADLKVYIRAPGVVARCARCDNVAMVLVNVRGITCVDLEGLKAIGRPGWLRNPPVAGGTRGCSGDQ